MQGTSFNALAGWLNEIKKIPTGNCAAPRFLKPFHFVTLGLAVKQAGWSALELPEELKSYAVRMQLWEAVGIKTPHPMKKNPPKGNFLPVEALHNSNKHVDRITNHLVDLIKKNVSKEYRESLSICLQEIANNFFDHANVVDGSPCLICAQSWPKGNLVQIAIADTGIGIRKSLSGNEELSYELSTYNACKLASKYGVTSKPGTCHSGFGLALANDLMAKSNGTYVLLSGNEMFVRERGENISFELDCTWHGTLLILEWNIDSDLNVKAVYDDWPASPL